MAENLPRKPVPFLAPLFLFVAATVIPEVLIGSTPLSRLNTLLFQFPLYGSAALVIREAVVRFRLSRAGLLALGLAYGVTIEGLALQSLFNPRFLGLNISFGRAGDVNWPWALYMIGYHALWSITVPITLAELVFPRRAADSWLGRIGTGAFLVLLALMTFAFHAIFVKMSGFQATPARYVSAAVVIAGLVTLAPQLKRSGQARRPAASSGFTSAFVLLLLGLAWLGLYGDIFHSPHFVPAAANLVLGLLLVLVFAGLRYRLLPDSPSPRQAFGFVVGALGANTLFGFVVVSGSAAKLDLYGQFGVLVLLALGLTALGGAILRRAAKNTNA